MKKTPFITLLVSCFLFASCGANPDKGDNLKKVKQQFLNNFNNWEYWDRYDAAASKRQIRYLTRGVEDHIRGSVNNALLHYEEDTSTARTVDGDTFKIYTGGGKESSYYSYNRVVDYMTQLGLSDHTDMAVKDFVKNNLIYNGDDSRSDVTINSNSLYSLISDNRTIETTVYYDVGERSYTYVDNGTQQDYSFEKVGSNKTGQYVLDSDVISKEDPIYFPELVIKGFIEQLVDVVVASQVSENRISFHYALPNNQSINFNFDINGIPYRLFDLDVEIARDSIELSYLFQTAFTGEYVGYSGKEIVLTEKRTTIDTSYSFGCIHSEYEYECLENGHHKYCKYCHKYLEELEEHHITNEYSYCDACDQITDLEEYYIDDYCYIENCHNSLIRSELDIAKFLISKSSNIVYFDGVSRYTYKAEDNLYINIYTDFALYVNDDEGETLVFSETLSAKPVKLSAHIYSRSRNEIAPEPFVETSVYQLVRSN